MQENMKNSHFSFARIFILEENMPLRSLQLRQSKKHQAVKKPLQIWKSIRRVTEKNLKHGILKG
jgi:hypothetical protein